MSLKWLMGQKDLSGRLARWSLKLQAFQFDIVHRKGAANIVPDALSRMYVEEIADISNGLELDLSATEFQEAEYLDLIERITKDNTMLPDLKVLNGVVLKRTKFRLDEHNENVWKIWVPQGLRRQLIEKYHCDTSAGHGGVGKTLYRLRAKYYWPGMVVNTRDYIADCGICKSTKAINNIARPYMGSQISSERIFQRLFIDFCGPYPRSRIGNSYVFVVLDHYSKFVFLKPMRSATTAEVVKYLENDIFHVFGVPEVIVSDNGRQFTSETFNELLNKYGVKHMRTAIYAPQSNSSERVNRSMLAIIRAYISEADQKGWDTHVSKAAFALRSSFHEAVGMEPYREVFGQSMMQHGNTYELLRKLTTIKESDTEVLPKDAGLQLLRDKISRSLKQAYEKGKKNYDLRARKVNYNVGQCVYRRNYKLSDASKHYSAKLAPKYLKSIVLKVIGNSLYELGDLKGKSVGIYHAENIRI